MRRTGGWEMAAPKIELDRIWADFSDGDTAAIAANLGITEGELVGAVAMEVLSHAKGLTGTMRRHLFDLIVFAFLASMVLVFVFVSRQSFPHGKSHQVVAVAPGGIARYHVIEPQDVAIRNVPTVDNSLGRLEDVLGHYAIAEVQENATIRTGQLSSGTITPAELTGREALLVSLKSAGLTPARLPALVSLYISDKTSTPGKKKAVKVEDVYVISVSADFAVVAVRSAEVSKIADLLATSDVFISERIH